MPPKPSGPSHRDNLSTLRARVGELEQEVVRRQREAETMAAAARLAGESLAVEDLAERVARSVLDLFGAASACIRRLEPDGSLVTVAWVGRSSAPAFERGQALPAGITTGARAVALGRAVWTPDVLTDPDIRPTPDLRRLGEATEDRAVLAVPLKTGGAIIGAIIIGYPLGRVLAEDEVRLAGAFADQVTLTLENARLFADDRRKLAELSALYELSRAVTGQLDTAQLVEAVHREVARVLDVRNLAIFFYDPARRELEIALREWDGTREPDLPRRRALGVGLATAVVTRRAPLRTADYAAACEREAVVPVPEALAMPHWLGVPIVAGDDVLGVLTLAAAARPFTEADERLLSNIASLTALALRSARLYEERSVTYRELTQAQDHLVRTEKLRALGEMAAGVAHDFNNLLAVIVGRAELLLRRAQGTEIIHGLQTIHQAALDGAQTVRRIQEFTRTRRTRPFRQVNLLDIVREVVEMTRPRWKDEAQSRGVSYDVEIQGGPGPWVAGRPEELREVFTNLLANALEAMPAGGRLVFGLEAEERGAVVTVRDTGVGMSPETARRVFEPFFTTKGPQGSGLGLAVVWGIVARHGGTVEVDSRPGEGSTFTMRLPWARSVREPPAGSAPARPVRPARVLVVDDEAGVRAVLRELLGSEGYTVVDVPDGPSGLALCETEAIDVVLSDVSMPGMSGWEVAEACHARFPDVPVGLITGWGDRLDPDELARHGVRFVVAKPFQAAEVLHRVGDALAGGEKT
jgi:signal transduction histidine kinase